MGLDTVGLVLECEEVFGVKITDADAEKVYTVGDLHRLLVRLMQPRPAPVRCVSAPAFYRLRRGLVGFGIGRDRVRVSAKLTDLVPRPQRRVLWDNLAHATQLQLPELRHPDVLIWASLGTAVAVAVATILCVYRPLGYHGAFAAAALTTLPIWTATYKLVAMATPSLAVEFPRGCVTMRDVTYRAVGLNHQIFARGGSLGASEIWQVLRTIIAEQLAVLERDITPETRFIEDLGC